MPADAGIFRLTAGMIRLTIRFLSRNRGECSIDQISSRPEAVLMTCVLGSVPHESGNMDQSAKKLIAAKASLEYIQHGMVVGIGTGSTVNHLIDLLPGVQDKIDAVVSSSADTKARLNENGFEVTALNKVGDVDVYIDGADEATKHRHLIKGGGGALTREKVIAGSARKFICIIDESKLVGMLGTFPLPIEVLPMAQAFVARQLVKMRGQPIWRENFVTDNGNHILDIHNLPITNPLEMETRLNQVPGVITVGIFAHRPADVMLIADDKGVRTMGQ